MSISATNWRNLSGFCSVDASSQSRFQRSTGWFFIDPPPPTPGFNFADIKSTLITNPRKESSRPYHFMASGLSDLEV
jgi:hypothetical protein